MAVSTPDWLSRHNGELRANSDGETFAIYFGPELEYALRVIRYFHPEVFVHLRVPRAREIADGDAAVDHVLLELEAKDDVHPVGHFVRLDPDQ